MWDLLSPTPADCEDDLILRTKHEGRRRTIVSVYEAPPQFVGEHLTAYLAHFGQMLSASSDDLNGGWNFKIVRS